MTPQNGNITISREVLRLELENLRLGLVNELATKVEVDEVTRRQDAFDRGEFSVGMLLAIKAMILKEISDAKGGLWLLRANKAAYAVCFLSACAVVVSAVSLFLR